MRSSYSGEKLPPPPTTILILTIRAEESYHNRRDWDWIISFYVKKWETENRAKLEKEYSEFYKRPDYHVINTHFGWYHCHEICDRSFYRAIKLLQSKKRSLLVPAKWKEHIAFSRELLRDVVYPECEVEFDNLAKELNKHGMHMYDRLAPKKEVE
jgi:hypothetical protein